MEVCRPCIGLGCDNPPDLAAGIDSAIFSALDYSFIVQCPTNCFCPPGLFPKTIVILASTIPPVIPPIDEGGDIILRLQGCTSLITRILPAGSSQADIQSAAVSMQAEWAGQQSLCIALATPGVNCNTGSSITVCNDEQDGWCGDVTPAGFTCKNLVTTGLTQSQIDAAVAALKQQLNQIARLHNCLGWLCPITLVRTNPGGNSIQLVLVKNVSLTQTIDISGLQYCIDNPPGTCFPPSLPLPPTSVGPNSTISFSGGSTAFSAAWRIKNNGITILSPPLTPVGFTDTVTLVVGCA